MPYRRLEFAPRSPFHDIEATVTKIRQANPGITDMGVNQAVKRMLTGYKSRHKGRVIHLFGADIMAADLTTIPAWQWVTPGEQRRVMQYPVDTGERVPNDVDGPVRRMVQEELRGRLNSRAVNRSVLISPPGLQQTYVWRHSNGWIQEVTDDDYALILSTPTNRRLFRDPDIHGAYVPVRSYEAPGEVITVARNLNEVDYAMRQLKSTPHWQGADTAD